MSCNYSNDCEYLNKYFKILFNDESKPLTRKEELEIFETGDEKYIIDMLVKHNLRMIYGISKKYKCIAEITDLIQIGVIALLDAYKTYDKDVSKFSTYAYRRVKWGISAYIKEENDNLSSIRNQSVITFDYYDESKQGDFIEHEILETYIYSQTHQFGHDCVSYNYESHERVNLYNVLKKSIDNHRLTDREKLVIQRRYIDDVKVKYNDIGKELGISGPMVRYIEQDAVKKMRFALQDSGFRKNDFF